MEISAGLASGSSTASTGSGVGGAGATGGGGTEGAGGGVGAAGTENSGTGAGAGALKDGVGAGVGGGSGAAGMGGGDGAAGAAAGSGAAGMGGGDGIDGAGGGLGISGIGGGSETCDWASNPWKLFGPRLSVADGSGMSAVAEMVRSSLVRLPMAPAETAALSYFSSSGMVVMTVFSSFSFFSSDAEAGGDEDPAPIPGADEMTVLSLGPSLEVAARGLRMMILWPHRLQVALFTSLTSLSSAIL